MEPIKDTIRAFLQRCAIPYAPATYDVAFEEKAVAAALGFGYNCINDALRPPLPAGVLMSTTAYAHLEDESTRIFICLYTAFLIYVDDSFLNDATHVREFNTRFVRNQKQGDPVLDDMADLLLRMDQHFGLLEANIILTSALNFVSSLALEYDTQGMELNPSAMKYTAFARTMSGSSEAYALFLFPRDIPLQQYIQALPDLMTYLNNTNDVLSFYKEELVGEQVNYVSLVARCGASTKYDALEALASACVDADRRVIEILAPSARCSEIYKRFRTGYIGFHSAERYKLKDLDL